jgi:hypothetical protein
MMTALRPQHRQRPAYVYLRQSPPGQVHTHRDSTERQYALAERAVELGWDRSQVHILDQDLGKSGPPRRDGLISTASWPLSAWARSAPAWR